MSLSIEVRRERLLVDFKNFSDSPFRGHVRWLTITFKENVKDKKHFLSLVNGLFKELSEHGFDLKHSFVVERCKYGFWHSHGFAYLLKGDWDYRAIFSMAVKRGASVDFIRRFCKT